MLLIFDCSWISNHTNGLKLNLLLLKLMRVAPLNLQLASTKNILLHGCTSFICCGRAATGLESPSHQKVGPTNQPHDDLKLKHSPVSEEVNKTCTADLVDFENTNEDFLKSSLKKPATSVVASVNVNGGECKNENGDTEIRKVQWTDVFGGELFEIREYEPSEHSDSDDESNWNEGKCTCRIM